MSDQNWSDNAACRDEDPDSFYPVQESKPGQPPTADERAALAVCDRCLALADCQAWAMTDGLSEWGVIGGMTASQRIALRRAEQDAAA